MGERIVSTLDKDQCKVLITYCSLLLRMRNVPDKSCTENQNKRFMFNNSFPNHAQYEITWKNTAQPERSQTTIRLMRTACWVPKLHTHTHTHNTTHAHCMLSTKSYTHTHTHSQYDSCALHAEYQKLNTHTHTHNTTHAHCMLSTKS